jgi:outer membrane receptor protein involved in Fe transport
MTAGEHCMKRNVDFCWRVARGRALVLCLLLLTPLAQAQEKPKDTSATASAPEEVVITGSRIARPELDRLQPTTVVGAAALDQRAYTDIGQALSDVPEFGIQASSAANQQPGVGIGQSFVDLLSLGSQRTLVLVDGLRFVTSNSPNNYGGSVSPGQQVDLNVIPTKLVDRVEVVGVGGAPIYGADAIAGTVNIILKKNYEGLDVDAAAGIANAGDAFNYRLRGLAGTNFAGGRGNVTGVVEFTKGDGLLGTARAVYASDAGFEAPPASANSPYSQVYYSQPGQVSSISISGVPMVDDFFITRGHPSALTINSPTGQILAFAPGSSSLQPYNIGTATGNPIFWIGGDGIRLSQFSNLLAATQKTNADVIGTFKVTDHVNAFAGGWFSATHNTNLISQPAYNTTLFGGAGTVNGAFKISVNNPFLSAADRATIQSALNAYGQATAPSDLFDPSWDNQHFYVQRANEDLQDGRATATQILARGVLGMKGDFELLEGTYNWDVAVNYGSSRSRNDEPAYVFQNVQNALNAVSGPNGTIVCGGTPVAAAISTLSSTCAPLNIFGAGSPSLLALQYITHIADQQTIDAQRDVTGNLSGPLLKLPAGEWRAAIGYENRRESAKFTPDAFFTGTDSSGGPFGQLSSSAIEGAYVTNEVYGETLIPVFSAEQGIPALHQLELEGAGRRVDNSIAGTATTWTAGLRWSPIKDLQLRANRTVSIRAPAVTELFLPSSTAYEFAQDPCDNTQVALGTAPTTRAKNCAAAGINTATFTSNVINATAKGTTSGNAGLTSETANSKTFGVVLRPRWVPSLSASVDYIEIDVSNAIEQLNLTEILDACYDSTSYPNNQYCQLFQRNAQGQIASFHDGFVNAGLRDVEAITSTVDWGVELPDQLGKLDLRASFVDTTKLTEKVGAASVNDLRGELFNTNIAAPQGKGVFSLLYDKGPIELFWQAQYISPMKFSNTDTPKTRDIRSVGEFWVFNTTVSYRPTNALTARLIVDNVFDTQPPYAALAGVQGNFSTATSLYFTGIIGRTYLLSLDYAF